MRAINFHGIGTPGRDLEPGEALYWLSRTAFEELISALTQLRLDREILFTFDDGNRSDIEIAAPVLASHGLTGRIFVLTGRLGSAGSLGATEVRSLHEQGFMIGSHGIDHVDWSEASLETLRRELCDSRSKLEELLNCAVTEVAIPFGRYNARVLRTIRESGYTAAWTSDGGKMELGAFLRPRLSIRADMDASAVHSAVLGQEGLRERLRRRMAMLRKRLL